MFYNEKVSDLETFINPYPGRDSEGVVTQRETTFSEFTTTFDGKFTAPPELIQIRPGQTRTSHDQK
ncbi:hypothetical protein E2C01_100614 [Portunus trituberculatus]|uniref:Uncharacterized protein n=1 Tax=Portunus trituberculatus TaxID=210409 RepID=A0A5B7K8I0_PORTR|nr:hypothetical protein [Portunus trituberculatus]